MVQDWPRDPVPRHQSYSQPRYQPDPFDQRRYYDGPENIRHPPMVRVPIRPRVNLPHVLTDLGIGIGH